MLEVYVKDNYYTRLIVAAITFAEKFYFILDSK